MNKAKLSDRIAWVMTLVSLISVIFFFSNLIPSLQNTFEGAIFMSMSLMGFGMTIMISEYEDRLEKGKTMMRLISSSNSEDLDR